MGGWRLLGEILNIPREKLEEALGARNSADRRLGEVLLGMNLITPEMLARALAAQQELPYLEAVPVDGDTMELLEQIPIAYAKENRIFPFARAAGRIKVAVADPLDNGPLNDLAALTGDDLEICVATPQEILRAIHRGYERRAGKAQEMIADIGGDEAEAWAGSLEPEDLLDTADEAPVIRFVNSFITQAHKRRASDIHIEPFEQALVVRFRIDGILYEVLRPPPKARASIVSRIKIMANLNIAEKRLPQDGRFRVRIAGKDVDVRVSTLPTAFGERVVLRLLEKGAGLLSLEDVGIDAAMLPQVKRMITRSHGIFLVTGPTGSGKTTTLYAALTRLNTREKNIITVEDPIEYQLAGVGQTQVNPKIALTFASGLRSILRQDPDIIMVGEVRDAETAEIAVQAALTGHLVFSTLHTNDAAGALTRLVDMGVEPFLAASTIVGILAQRLVRKICPHCKEAYRPGAEALREMALEKAVPAGATFYRGRGCEQCMNIGYRGRTGIYELLTIDDQIRELLLNNRDAAGIRNAALRKGMVALRESGVAKALAGETSIEEVLRVTQEEA